MADIARLSPSAFRASLDSLADILLNCVEGGASLTFIRPFTHAAARAFFTDLVPAVDAGTRVVLGAKENGALMGCIQFDLDTTPDQPHRVSAMKLLVHAKARGHGLGRALMVAMENEVRATGRTLITFGTEAGGRAEELYHSLGYSCAGVIPGYAFSTEGKPIGLATYYKHLT